MIDLTTHINDVAKLLFYEDIDRAILLAHSYSGMVITGVAQTVPQRVGQLIYFDAYVPQPGQSRWDLLWWGNVQTVRAAAGWARHAGCIKGELPTLTGEERLPRARPPSEGDE